EGGDRAAGSLHGPLGETKVGMGGWERQRSPVGHHERLNVPQEAARVRLDGWQCGAPRVRGEMSPAAAAMLPGEYASATARHNAPAMASTVQERRIPTTGPSPGVRAHLSGESTVLALPGLAPHARGWDLVADRPSAG